MSEPACASPGTVRQAVVLVGGLGTRLGAIAAETPKPLLEVGGRPFMAWVLRELCRYGVEEVLLLAGHRAQRVREAVPRLLDDLPRRLAISVVEETQPAGTGGALHHAQADLHGRFLLLNGDSLFDTNWAALLADAARDRPPVLGRLLLRRTDHTARFGVVAMAGDRVTGFRARPGGAAAGIINAGIAVLSRAIAAECAPMCSLERDVLPRLAGAGALRGTVRDGWFVDIGVPEDLARTGAEIPGRLLRRPALILDRDGVLNVDHGYVGTRERLDWMPGAVDAVRGACDRGWHVFVATNQSGVARGLYDEAAVSALHAHMGDVVREAGGTIDDWRYCPTHPQGSVAAYARENDWRKPGAGMLRDLIRAWELDPAACLMLGDQPSDVLAARAAGIDGVRFAGGDLRTAVTQLLDSRPRIPA